VPQGHVQGGRGLCNVQTRTPSPDPTLSIHWHAFSIHCLASPLPVPYLIPPVPCPTSPTALLQLRGHGPVHLRPEANQQSFGVNPHFLPTSAIYNPTALQELQSVNASLLCRQHPALARGPSLTASSGAEVSTAKPLSELWAEGWGLGSGWGGVSTPLSMGSGLRGRA